MVEEEKVQRTRIFVGTIISKGEKVHSTVIFEAAGFGERQKGAALQSYNNLN